MFEVINGSGVEEEKDDDKKRGSLEYKVEKAIIETISGDEEIRWYITKDGLPEYLVNDFIESKSIKKINTGKKYAYSLVKFLNFIGGKGIHYTKCTTIQAKLYVRYLIFGEMEDLKVLDKSHRISMSTLRGDITVMTEFYKYLRDEEADTNIVMKDGTITNKYAFLYGQIFEVDYSKIVDSNVGNLSKGKRYIKWYSEEEIEAISSNFTTLRDKVVFLLTVEGGMRIDEVLSLQMESIDHIDRTVQPIRSKRKEDGSEQIRIVALTEETYKLLNDYIDNERATAESESGQFINEVFINLNKGKNQGLPLKYSNYREILKTAAKKAGLNPKLIRTHSGRSTKVDALLEHQVKYPEDNLTDEIIRQMMGWEDGNSIQPYKNSGNKAIALAASNKVIKRKAVSKSDDVPQQEINLKIKDMSEKVFEKKKKPKE